MMSPNRTKPASFRFKPAAAKVAIASVIALSLVGCKHIDEPAQVAGWSIADPTARHPILVSQQPSNLNVRVPRGAYGLSPHQRAQVAQFVERYRGGDSGNSKLIISAPSGAPNEVASMQAVAEIRHMLRDIGYDETAINVEAYHEDRDPQPPVRISYLRYIAEGPACGCWPTNLAREPENHAMPNLGCAQQQNLAAQIANPSDLLGPRGRTPATGERRQVIWEKYTKGESTISQKQGDEKVQVKGAQ